MTRPSGVRSSAAGPGRCLPHPASSTANLEAFALLNAATASFVQNKLVGGPDRQRRNAACLQHVLYLLPLAASRAAHVAGTCPDQPS